MSKQPCYTCEKPFVDTKLQTLLEYKRQEAKEHAKKNNYTGAIAIVRLASGNGFVFVEAKKKEEDQKAVEYLLFNKGVPV